MVGAGPWAHARPMTATTIPSGRRTAATWVGATGAFLLVAAAAVFVAVRWDELTETAKLALVGGLTGAFLVAGRTVRRTLPATGDVLFHLGAFLVPVDLAALCLRMDAGWRVTVLAEGVVGVLLFAALGRFTGSVVLRWAAAASVFTLAAGVAAVTPVPATLALAVIAIGADVAARRSGLRRATAVWAAVAGLAPALGVAAGWVLTGAGVVLGTGTLTELGLTGDAQQSVALASGLLAAYVLARQAGANRDLRLAYLALASVAVGLGTTAMGAEVSGPGLLLGAAGLFVMIEIGALVFFDDDFWGRPLADLATGAETFAWLGTAFAGFFLAAAPLIDHLGAADVEATRDVAVAASLLVVALGWLTVDIRRAVPAMAGGSGLVRRLVRGGGWAPATVGCAVALAAAVEFGTMASVPTALAMVSVAGAAIVARRAGAVEIAAAAVPLAVATVVLHPLAAPLIGVAGGVVLAIAARSRNNLALAVEGTVVAVVASFLTYGMLPEAATVGVAVAVAWGMALVLGSRFGDVARLALLAPVAAACLLEPAEAVGPLLAIAALYTLDAVRLRRPVIAFGTAAAVQPLAVVLAQTAGVPLPWAGFAVAVCAVVWAGLAFVVDDEWRPPFVAAAVTGLSLGLILSSADRLALCDTLLLVGATGIATAIGLRNLAIGHLGGVVLTIGLFGHLQMSGVTASEPFVLPVAAQLLVAGWFARQRHPEVSSWIAYVPAVALAGGAALAERVGGGAGWHALVAGAVGVAAVALGGWRKLSGPMVVGTALVAVVAVRESLSALAGVPTWAWLGLGGTLLLVVAVVLERTDTSPIEAGRRVVEVMSERFS